MRTLQAFGIGIGFLAWTATKGIAAEPWVTYQGTHGPGVGKKIVLLAGDEEYRSEEALPALARILAYRHGFTCTVLFSIDPQTGCIDPNNQTNVPGLFHLQDADLVVLFWRFRELPDQDMKEFVDYLLSGRPIVALRTATHAFAYRRNRNSPYARFDFRSKTWPGGFGQQVLGETWAGHHGWHGRESTRAIPNPKMKDHPILRCVRDVWVPTDVYRVVHLPKDAQVLLYGQVLQGMNPDSPPVKGKKNHPMMPVAWIRYYKNEAGRTNRIFTTTMGSGVDLLNEGFRRLLVNACYWALGMEDQIPKCADVRFVGEYKPHFYGFGKFVKGVRPQDLRLTPEQVRKLLSEDSQKKTPGAKQK